MKTKIKELTNKYTVIEEIVTKEVLFYRELTALLNKHSKENDSNTPCYILATYLINCLNAFNLGVNNRNQWHDSFSNTDTIEKHINEN